MSRPRSNKAADKNKTVQSVCSLVHRFCTVRIFYKFMSWFCAAPSSLQGWVPGAGWLQEAGAPQQYYPAVPWGGWGPQAGSSGWPAGAGKGGYRGGYKGGNQGGGKGSVKGGGGQVQQLQGELRTLRNRRARARYELRRAVVCMLLAPFLLCVWTVLQIMKIIWFCSKKLADGVQDPPGLDTKK